MTTTTQDILKFLGTIHNCYNIKNYNEATTNFLLSDLRNFLMIDEPMRDTEQPDAIIITKRVSNPDTVQIVTIEECEGYGYIGEVVKLTYDLRCIFTNLHLYNDLLTNVSFDEVVESLKTISVDGY